MGSTHPLQGGTGRLSSSSTPGAGVTAAVSYLLDECCNEELPSPENNYSLSSWSRGGQSMERSHPLVQYNYHKNNYKNKATNTHIWDLDKNRHSPSLLFFSCCATGKHLDCSTLSNAAWSYTKKHFLNILFKHSNPGISFQLYQWKPVSIQHSHMTLLLHSCWQSSPKENRQCLTGKKSLTQYYNYVRHPS